MSRQSFTSLLAAMFLLAPLVCRASEHDDLEAAFNKAVESFNARDLDAFMQSFHTEVVTFDGAPFPRENRAARRKDFEGIYANTERALFTPVNPKFRVVGETGLAWGHWALALKPKDGPANTVYGRYTIVSTKTDGKWLVVNEHFSPIPTN